MIKISKESWHYHLAKRGGYESYSPRELCGYTRRVLLGLLLTLVVGAVFLMLCLGIMDLVFALWFWVSPNTPGSVMFGFLCGCVALAAAGLVGKAWDFLFGWDGVIRRGRVGKTTASTAAIIKESYLGWKGRYCPRIHISGDHEPTMSEAESEENNPE